MGHFETTVKRVALIESIEDNMKKHQAVVEEAITGYRKKVISILEENLAAAREGKYITHVIQLTQPTSHMKDYERILRMLKMDTKEEITLSESQFAMYVMDDWGWKHNFLASNVEYSGMARQCMMEASLE